MVIQCHNVIETLVTPSEHIFHPFVISQYYIHATFTYLINNTFTHSSILFFFCTYLMYLFIVPILFCTLMIVKDALAVTIIKTPEK